MPWTADDAERHTHTATTWELKGLWAKVANECLKRTGRLAKHDQYQGAAVSLPLCVTR
jgi:hypothetical protein